MGWVGAESGGHNDCATAAMGGWLLCKPQLQDTQGVLTNGKVSQHECYLQLPMHQAPVLLLLLLPVLTLTLLLLLALPLRLLQPWQAPEHGAPCIMLQRTPPMHASQSDVHHALCYPTVEAVLANTHWSPPPPMMDPPPCMLMSTS